MSRTAERLEELDTSLAGLEQVLDVRIREAKRAEAKVREGAFSYERQAMENLDQMRSAAASFVERQLREVERIASEAVASEQGSNRAIAQRITTQWIASQRASAGRTESEWTASQRAVADVAARHLKGSMQVVQQQVTAELGELLRLKTVVTEAREGTQALVKEVQELAAKAASASPQAARAKPVEAPRPRRSVPRRSIMPPKKK